ncbi:hypothetical protein [Nocardia africana]|nr:hypothetical protein [Nocardia africana]
MTGREVSDHRVEGAMRAQIEVAAAFGIDRAQFGVGFDRREDGECGAEEVFQHGHQAHEIASQVG